MKLTEEQIKSIADELIMGMNVYVHIETNEIKTVMDPDSPYADMEVWEDDLKELEKNSDKYFAFEIMDSGESFRVMEDFVATVKDKKLKEKLELGLRLTKPFRNFKDIIEEENEYSNRWHEFRDSRYVEFLEEQIERYNRNI